MSWRGCGTLNKRPGASPRQSSCLLTSITPLQQQSLFPGHSESTACQRTQLASHAPCSVLLGRSLKASTLDTFSWAPTPLLCIYTYMCTYIHTCVHMYMYNTYIHIYTLYIVVPQCPQEIGSRTLGCSSPLYKMVQYLHVTYAHSPVYFNHL